MPEIYNWKLAKIKHVYLCPILTTWSGRSLYGTQKCMNLIAPVQGLGAYILHDRFFSHYNESGLSTTLSKRPQERWQSAVKMAIDEITQCYTQK